MAAANLEMWQRASPPPAKSTEVPRKTISENRDSLGPPAARSDAMPAAQARALLSPSSAPGSPRCSTYVVNAAMLLGPIQSRLPVCNGSYRTLHRSHVPGCEQQHDHEPPPSVHSLQSRPTNQLRKRAHTSSHVGHPNSF
ncbi:hypothetical protein PaG_05426 [Moesziomyces aphidis]|uniref:Uncharacterized protein n=1 Tax=Moesziomyces aphidis TaxID=84754 RepID=W3VGC1_MOEAP|nr:hypothetical protein PaG_05426 [Moesziomyces aphidis]